MDEEAALQWINSYEKFGSKFGLERITMLLDRLGNPQKNFYVIHVTGTNGKGSVCLFLGSILQHAGYKVGVYLSPHLQRFTERIQVNTQEISPQELCRLVEQVKPVVEEISLSGETPTYFEIVTAMAFLSFSQQQVEYAVVEVGLGGRLDATNVVSPMVSVITTIALEHTDVLGDSLKSIAREKAGIIKQDTPVVTAAKHTALEVIETIAKEHNAPLIIVNESSWRRINCTMTDQEFLIHGRFKDYPIRTHLLGEYQGENIAVAILTAEQLQMKGVYLSDPDIIEGVSNTVNPGRLEVITQDPIILLDGAHNPQGTEKLKQALTTDFSYSNLILILGILKEKDYPQMVSILAPLAQTIICTRTANPRFCDPLILQKTIRELSMNKTVLVEPTIPQAIEHARTLAQPNDLICITGSLFTVGEARTILKTNKYLPPLSKI
ncbi:MAG: folylpolyglutamate synthase/dihydrofolate synthase family protein [Methanobacteriota archaeon]